MKNKSKFLFALLIFVFGSVGFATLNSCERCYTCKCYYYDIYGNIYETTDEVCGRDEKEDMEDAGCDCD